MYHLPLVLDSQIHSVLFWSIFHFCSLLPPSPPLFLFFSVPLYCDCHATFPAFLPQSLSPTTSFPSTLICMKLYSLFNVSVPAYSCLCLCPSFHPIPPLLPAHLQLFCYPPCPPVLEQAQVIRRMRAPHSSFTNKFKAETLPLRIRSPRSPFFAHLTALV